MFKFRKMKKYVVWSIYALTGSHINDWIEARTEDEAMEKADQLPNRLSYEAKEVYEFSNGTIPKGNNNKSINIHEYNPN